MLERDRRDKVLIVLHQDHSTPGRIGAMLAERGFALDIRREIDWLAVPLSEDKPLLGVCLGAQMLARHLGAAVFTYPDKRSEIGYYPIAPTPDADRLCAAPFPRSVYHWHCDGFVLPQDKAELLAEAQPQRIAG